VRMLASLNRHARRVSEETVFYPLAKHSNVPKFMVFGGTACLTTFTAT
jgi:hypothetical protein